MRCPGSHMQEGCKELLEATKNEDLHKHFHGFTKSQKWSIVDFLEDTLQNEVTQTVTNPHFKLFCDRVNDDFDFSAFLQRSYTVAHDEEKAMILNAGIGGIGI